MQITMKYYIVSIGAIFIALGIGMLVGFNLNYDQEMSKQQANIISDLDKKFDNERVAIGSKAICVEDWSRWILSPENEWVKMPFSK